MERWSRMYMPSDADGLALAIGPPADPDRGYAAFLRGCFPSENCHLSSDPGCVAARHYVAAVSPPAQRDPCPAAGPECAVPPAWSHHSWPVAALPRPAPMPAIAVPAWQTGLPLPPHGWRATVTAQPVLPPVRAVPVPEWPAQPTPSWPVWEPPTRPWSRTLHQNPHRQSPQRPQQRDRVRVAPGCLSAASQWLCLPWSERPPLRLRLEPQ